MLGADSFVSTPIVTESGHARALEDTYAFVAPLLRRVPITRVLDLTPIDALGLPVWSAVTPLAKDLTVHAGKGRTSAAARLSAIMEAIERVSAETLPPERVRRATFRALEGEAIDPALFDLPFETTYAPDRAIDWVRGYDLVTRRHAWVARDLVVSPAEEGVCLGVETNGLASGNSITEATLHALYELVERDALASEVFTERFVEGAAPPRMIDPTTLPDAARRWTSALGERGVRTVVQDIGQLGVAVFSVKMVDESFRESEGHRVVFDGQGADLDAERAVVRAITEAAQSHALLALSARDTFDGMRPQAFPTWRLRRLGAVLRPAETAPFATTSASSGDLAVDLERVVAHLAGAGFAHCVVVDLTRGDLDVPVVRVLVPGLAGPEGTTRRPPLRFLRRLL